MDKPPSKFVVLGEASESDEDDLTDKPAFRRGIVTQCIKPIIAGEASESDHDSDDYYNIATFAFAAKSSPKPRTSAVKYNSLLHKKLRENNLKMRRDLEDFVRSKFEFGTNEVSGVNQRLLAAQVHLQEAATSLRKSSANSVKLQRLLENIDHTKFLGNVNPDAFIH